jgi:hypothetical protein
MLTLKSSTGLIYSRGQKKVGQCFFANVSLLALSMVTMKIFIYYSNPGLLNSILAKKKNQMSINANQKYCQSCHLISRNGFIITKIMRSQICC